MDLEALHENKGADIISIQAPETLHRYKPLHAPSSQPHFCSTAMVTLHVVLF